MTRQEKLGVERKIHGNGSMVGISDLCAEASHVLRC
jgi:hypothetical protein